VPAASGIETLTMVPAASDSTDLVVDQLSRAVAAHLAQYKGQSRMHTASELRSDLGWCAARRLDPLSASRVHVEVWIPWMQEIRRLQPKTVSRRVSVVAGFYSTCVIDGMLRRLAGGACPATTGGGGIAHPRSDASAVRRAAHRGPALTEP